MPQATEPINTSIPATGSEKITGVKTPEEIPHNEKFNLTEQVQPHALAERRKQLENVQIHETTYQALRDTASHYSIFKAIRDRNPPGALSPETRKFMSDFESAAKEASINLDTDERIDEVANKYITADRGDRLIGLMKLSEWEHATLSIGTGAFQNEITKPTQEPYVAEVHSVDAQGATNLSAQDIQEEKKVSIFRRIFRKAEPKTPEELAAREAVEAVQKVNKDLEKKRYSSGEYQVDFIDSSTGQSLPANADVDLVARNVIGPGGRNIDAFQQAFLEEAFKNKVTGVVDGRLNEDDQRALAERLISITDARLDLYRATGFPPNRVDINFIRYDPTTTSLVYAGVRADENIHFAVERTVRTGVDMRANTRDQIDSLFNGIRPKTEKKIRETLRSNKVDRIKTKLTTQAAELKRREGIPATDEQKAEQEKIQAEINDLKAKESELTKATDTLNEIVALQAQATALETKLGGSTGPILTLAAEPNAAGVYPPGSKGAYAEQLRKETAVQNSEAAERTEVRNQIVTLFEALKAKATLPPTFITQIQTDYTTLEAEWTALKGTIKTRATTIQTLTDTISQVEKQLGSGEGSVQAEINQLREHQRAIKKKQSELETLKITRSITSVGSIPTKTEFETAIKNTQVEKQKKQLEQEDIVNPDKTSIIYKKESVEQLQTVVNTYTEVQKRTLEAENKTLDTAVDKRYKNIPEPYLRMVQILYGPQIVQGGKDNEEQFKKVMRMLPPERFLQILRTDFNTILGAVIPRGDIYNALLFGPQGSLLASKIDHVLTNKVLNDLIDQAEDGKLGDINQAERIDMAQNRNVIATPMTFTRGSVQDARANTLLDKIYYYVDVNDLTRRILRQGAAFGVTVANVAEAKAYAEEVDKRRQTKF